MPTAAGHDAQLSFELESSFNGGGDGTTRPFGGDATLSTREGANNAVRVFEPGSRQAAQIVEQHFEGSFSVEFTVTNPYWLAAVLGGSAGSYGGTTPSSIQIYDGVGSYFDNALTGCVVSSATISASTQDTVTVTLDGAYADEDEVSGTQPTIENRALQFHDATLSLGGSTLNLIQEVELSIENNTDLVWELGSRFAVDFSPKQLTVSLDYTDFVNSSDSLERFYGGSTTPQSQVTNSSDATLTLDDGGSNTIEFSVSGLIPDTYSLDGIGDPEADIEGSISEMGCTVSATSSGYTTTT